MQAGRIRIGTRGSPLAQAQAREVRDRLLAAHGLDPAAFDLRIIRTSGDRTDDRPLAEVGGKGLFTKEIDEALIDGEIDLAVHSMKDMPALPPAGLSIAAVLPREDPRDAFISLRYGALVQLPPKATVGTSSPRRQAQVRRMRPDLTVVDLRGNVDTRLRKLEQGAADATFLAVAGLRRLGEARRITCPMPAEDMLPAVAQGAIGVVVRADDARIAALVAPINDQSSALCIAAERAFLVKLEGSCRTPIAGLAELGSGVLCLRGMILTPDGAECHAAMRTGAPAGALAMGEDLAAELLRRAGPGFFAGPA